MKTPFQQCRRMNLRLRPDIYEAVKRSATDNCRSMTAEINELLLEATKKASEPAVGSNSDAHTSVSKGTPNDE